MASNGIVEAFTGEKTVEVPKSEFEALVRDSERVEIIKRYFKSGEYITNEGMCNILNIGNEESEEESDGSEQ